ncbi:MAG: thiamine diphosphokinase [Bacteroidaceae bacterium]|nr:thiamine diphosphokinase [Bacteroidaceae bacterium]
MITYPDFDAVILADGTFPTDEHPLQILHSAKYLCCCDGAGMGLIERGLMPDAIVGDCDSMSAEFREQHKDIIHVIEEQDYNDLTKCTRHFLQNHTTDSLHSTPKIAYLGCTGKREDHTLGNISLMAFYMQEFGIEPYMFTDYGIFIPAHGNQTFPSAPHLQVSIFNIDCSRLTSEGLKWDAYPYRQLWQGTLNESTSNEFCIKANGTYIVYITYLPKY